VDVCLPRRRHPPGAPGGGPGFGFGRTLTHDVALLASLDAFTTLLRVHDVAATPDVLAVPEAVGPVR
jgi:dihydropteroate synthase